MIINHDTYDEDNRQPEIDLTDGLNSGVWLIIALIDKVSLAAITECIHIRYLRLVVDFSLDALKSTTNLHKAI